MLDLDLAEVVVRGDLGERCDDGDVDAPAEAAAEVSSDGSFMKALAVPSRMSRATKWRVV